MNTYGVAAFPCPPDPMWHYSYEYFWVVQIRLSIFRTFSVWKESLRTLQMLHRAQMAIYAKMLFIAFTSQVLWKHHQLAFNLQNVLCYHWTPTKRAIKFSLTVSYSATVRFLKSVTAEIWNTLQHFVSWLWSHKIVMILTYIVLQQGEMENLTVYPNVYVTHLFIILVAFSLLVNHTWELMNLSLTRS